jgi:hypothetical protein
MRQQNLADHYLTDVNADDPSVDTACSFAREFNLPVGCCPILAANQENENDGLMTVRLIRPNSYKTIHSGST